MERQETEMKRKLETETGNGNWKWKLETNGNKSGLSPYSSILLSNRYGTGFMSHALPLLLYCVLCDYCFYSVIESRFPAHVASSVAM